MSFSNSPGFIKKLYFADVPCENMLNYVMPSDELAICLVVQTYCDVFNISLTADSGVLTAPEVEELLQNVELSVRSYIDFSKEQKIQNEQETD